MSKYQICVSGAAAGETVEASHLLAYTLGAAIAKRCDDWLAAVCSPRG